MQERGDAQAVEILGRELQIFADNHRIFRYAAGVTARVGILFVDGGGEHADGAEEEVAIFGGGLLQAFDVTLDIACHVIEGFRKLPDFGGAAHFDALVEFGTADGAGGEYEAADRARDSHREKIPKHESDECYADDECERLGCEFLHTRIDARFVEAALG